MSRGLHDGFSVKLFEMLTNSL